MDRSGSAIEVREESISLLAEQALVPCRFTVSRVYDVTPVEGGLGGLTLTERALALPYEKDYDATRDGAPAGWSKIFDVSSWGLIAARSEARRIGGAVVAHNTGGAHALEGSADVAVLWDLRVQPELRGAGIGTRLFEAAERWALGRGCSMLKIETQNINVPACRFYAGRGCVLGAIHRFAYAELPEEVMLLWYKHLRQA
jgi:GNAT superfamily N-acetyltransferase